MPSRACFLGGGGGGASKFCASPLSQGKLARVRARVFDTMEMAFLLEKEQQWNLQTGLKLDEDLGVGELGF